MQTSKKKPSVIFLAFGALLAAYLLNKDKADSLEDYLDNLVFSGAKTVTLSPDPDEVQSFATYMENYKKLLPVEKTAVDC